MVKRLRRQTDRVSGKSARKTLEPGTIISSFQVVDKRGNVRTIPKNLTPQQVQEIVRRKMESRKKQQANPPIKRIRVQNSIPRSRFVEILIEMGFNSTRKGFSHPKYGLVLVPPGSRTSAYNFRGNPPVKKIIEEFVRSGGRI